MKMPSYKVSISCPRCKAEVGEVKVWLEVDYRLTSDGTKDKGRVDVDVKVDSNPTLRSFSGSSETIEHVCSDLELLRTVQGATVRGVMTGTP
jgi:hypothetical protein